MVLVIKDLRLSDPDLVDLVAAGDIVKTGKRLFSQLEIQQASLAKIELWYKGNQNIPVAPDDTPEMRRLLELARTPWLGLVVTTVAQALFVDGFHCESASKDDQEYMWDTWLFNGMPKHHIAIHRAAIGYGFSYATALPGIDPHTGESRAVLRGWSPMRCYALYLDPAFDEWPEAAITVHGAGPDKSLRVSIFDATYEHRCLIKGDNWVIEKSIAHNAGHVPVVRYTNQMDLDGVTSGEVEPFIGIASRLDKTVFDRLLVQHYNSWKKIYVAGLKKPKGMSEAEAESKAIKLRHKDLMVFDDPNTRVGTLDETSLTGFIEAAQKDIDDIAIMSQLNHLLTGRIENLAADTLVAANKPLTQKIFERQVSFGESHIRLMRLAAKLDGRDSVAADFRAHATWQDTDVRSLAQAADGLGKLAEMLGIPKRALWRMVPDVTESQAREWEEMLLSDDPVERFIASQKVSTAPRLTEVDDKADASPDGKDESSGDTE